MPPAMKFHMDTGASPRNSRIGNTPRVTPRSRIELDRLKKENADQQKELEQLRQQLRALGFAGKDADDFDPEMALKRDNAVAGLRSTLLSSQKRVHDVQDALAQLLVASAATSRAGHLRSLPELIGPPPEDRTWEDEWVPLKAESYRLRGEGEETIEDDMKYVREHDPLDQYMEQDHVREDVEALLAANWPRERALVYTVLFSCADPLGRALRDGDPCYAASTYALCDVLFNQRKGATEGARLLTKRSREEKAAATFLLYGFRTGEYSLSQREPAWLDLEEPDGTGFRGLTSSALTHATCDPRLFSAEGMMAMVVSEEGMNLRPQASDVICFESNADDEHGAHSAIVMSEHGGDFPPNTRAPRPSPCLPPRPPPRPPRMRPPHRRRPRSRRRSPPPQG